MTPSPSPTPPSAPSSPKLPYWQIPGVRPGFDADMREFESPSRGPRRWYDRERWEMEKARFGISGKPQPPWREATPVADILPALASRIGIGRSLALESFQTDWEKIVGPELARRCSPVALDGGTLVLSVAGAVWMFTLRRISQTTLLDAVKATPHGAEVKRIALRPSANGGGARP